MIQLHDSVLLLSEFPCFSNGLRHVRNYRAENFGDISMQRHLRQFLLERLIEDSARAQTCISFPDSRKQANIFFQIYCLLTWSPLTSRCFTHVISSSAPTRVLLHSIIHFIPGKNHAKNTREQDRIEHLVYALTPPSSKIASY